MRGFWIDAVLVGMLVAVVGAVAIGGTQASRRSAPATPVAFAPPIENEALEHTLGEEAILFRNLQKQDEKGEIAPNGLTRAKTHVDLMEAAASRETPAAGEKGASAAGIEPVAGIDRTGWEWLGPGNIGGRIRSILIHPTATDTMWAGSATGGVFKTTNGGASWTHLDDFMANLAVASLVAHPSTPNTIYAGTGESFTFNITGAGNTGAGVFKSTDGGTTWNQLPSTATAAWSFVNRLSINPGNSQMLLAAVSSGIMRSSDGGGSWTSEHSSTAAVKDLDYDPVNGNNAIAGGDFGIALYSVDAGDTWHAATGIPTAGSGRVEVAYHRGNPSIAYASVNRSSGTLYRSVDGGHTYTQVNTGTNYLATQGNYDNALWVSPTNPDVVIVGGVDLFRSINAGTALTKISDWAVNQQFVRGIRVDDSAHADHHAIVAHPGYDGVGNLTVFFGNDGGMAKTLNVLTVDDAAGWVELNNNLGATQFYGAAGNETTGTIIGGTQDNGTLRYRPADGTEAWHMTFGGDGGWNASDRDNSNYYYGEYVRLNIFRSSDAAQNGDYISGQFWNGAAWACKAAPFKITDACLNSQANFIAPFVIDPNVPTTILGGGASLWRTNDARTANTSTSGPSWASIKPSVGSFISSIAIAEGNSDVIYVGHNNGLIYKTANGTAATPTWTRIDLLAMPARMTLDLEIDPDNSQVLYATFGGFSADNVWRSENGGTDWVDVTGAGVTGLPDVPARSLQVNPENSDWLYVGTEIGVFASEDGGATWHVPNDGPANVPVDELFWMNGRLVAATHGRGIFRTESLSGPANDNLSAAQALAGDSGSLAATNLGAAKEALEPDHAGDDGGASVWFSWTAPSDGTLTVDTRTATNPVDTLLALYTGAAFGALTTVASNDDESHPTVLTSRVADVPVDAGTTYRLAVDGYDGGAGPATGDFTLNWAFVPSANVPGTPTGVSATPLDQAAQVTWTAPPDGGSPITGYTVVPYAGVVAQPATAVGNVLTALVGGLTNGTQYTFKVIAVNAVGPGAESAASNAVTPVAPAPSTIVTGPSGTYARSSAVFTLASNIGGAGFECRVNGGAWTACTSPYTRSNLYPGRWVLEFRALNAGTPDASPEVRELRVVRPFVADWDAIGKANVNVWRPASGGWLVQGMANAFFGRDGDVPVPAQWDADAAVDRALWRPASGGWYVEGLATQYFGAATDVPVPGQWDADPELDRAVWRPASGGWYVQGQATSYYGAGTDVPVPGDYDADAALDKAVFRPSNGGWYVEGSPTVFHGQNGDIPIPADWNGDGKTDIAVFRPANGTWYLRGISTTAFGAAGDIPMAGDFDADAGMDKVLFRPTTGAWYVDTGAPFTYFGVSTDVP
jgi:hypothetical protein